MSRNLRAKKYSLKGRSSKIYNEREWLNDCETMMNNPNQDKDHKEEESSGKKEEKDSSDIRRENKPSRLAERKGQRPAFPFKRKSV